MRRLGPFNSPPPHHVDRTAVRCSKALRVAQSKAGDAAGLTGLQENADTGDPGVLSAHHPTRGLEIVPAPRHRSDEDSTTVPSQGLPV